MKYTEDYLSKKFVSFNKKFFDNELPIIEIQYKKLKRSMGQFRYYLQDFVEVPKCIVISSMYNFKVVEIEEILLHEMIHYYICHKCIYEKKSHGPKFMEMAKKINEKSNNKYNISEYYKNELIISDNDNNKIYHYITFDYNGKQYWARVSKNLMDKIRNNKNFVSVLTNIAYYETTDNKLNLFKQCSSRITLNPLNKLNIKNYKQI